MSKAILVSATAVATLWSAAAFAEKWDMPMAYAASNFHSETGAEFAQCVTDGTDGALEIAVHPSGSLFSGDQIKRAVQTGQTQIGERLLSAHQNEDALFGVDSIPFLATSFEQHDKLWEAAKPAMEELLESQGLTLLYSVPWPPQGLYFAKPVNSVADMEGVKFRSYNNATARLAELTGMLPVQIEAAEISQAFATGVAESMVSSGATGYDRKVWESLTNFYEVDAWIPRNYIFVNTSVWDGESDEIKSVVTDCAAKAEEAGTKRAVDYTDFTLGELKKNGMSVEPPSEQLATELREIGDTMTAEWLDAAGDTGKTIVDTYNAN
ncbi:TRAP transporter substrate-binding protein [Acuticoccus sp. MNP-M23]|uniref:TRAP transporter substrate-binding protein n=1 Tax=Acuticoccus sp. MNP-M23 TaxID=3072793 RepID=UPI0028160776|nr:TRAP transporter substrate-binding protein [Acuticoccus sp. MNP-M23]WMS42399.1 TRAP transporter substrate-binding protein [Acuticoccus sp. MNP-M23]